MPDNYVIQKTFDSFGGGRILTGLTVMPPPPTPTPTISITPSVSVTPSVTPTISVTPSVSKTPSPTPTPSSSPTYYYLANKFNCRFVNCDQFLGQTTIQGNGFLTVGSFYTSSGDTNYVYQAVQLSNSSLVVSPSSVSTSDAFSNCGSACLAIQPSPSLTPSVTVTPSVTKTPSVTPTVTPTISVTPTVSPTPSITVTPTPTISISPSVGVFSYNLTYDANSSASACAGSPVVCYSDSPSLSIGYDLTTDITLQTSASIGYYCLSGGSCLDQKIWIYYNGYYIAQNFIC